MFMYDDILIEMDLGDLGYHDLWVSYDIFSDTDEMDNYFWEVDVVSVFINPIGAKKGEVDVISIMPEDKIEELEGRIKRVLEDNNE
jgi:hypothetical protein